MAFVSENRSLPFAIFSSAGHNFRVSIFWNGQALSSNGVIGTCFYLLPSWLLLHLKHHASSLAHRTALLILILFSPSPFLNNVTCCPNINSLFLKNKSSMWTAPFLCIPDMKFQLPKAHSFLDVPLVTQTCWTKRNISPENPDMSISDNISITPWALKSFVSSFSHIPHLNHPLLSILNPLPPFSPPLHSPCLRSSAARIPTWTSVIDSNRDLLKKLLPSSPSSPQLP